MHSRECLEETKTRVTRIARQRAEELHSRCSLLLAALGEVLSRGSGLAADHGKLEPSVSAVTLPTAAKGAAPFVAMSVPVPVYPAFLPHAQCLTGETLKLGVVVGKSLWHDVATCIDDGP